MVLIQLTETHTPGCTDVDQGYCVEQGPEWLAGLLVAPPGWVYALAALLVVGAIGFAAAAHRREPITQADVRDALGSIAIVGGCGLGAFVFRELAWFPYVVDLALGWGVGAGVGLVVASAVRADEPGDGEDADSKEVST